MAKKKDDGDEEAEEGGGKKGLMIKAGGGVLALGLVYNFVLKPAPPPDAMAMVDVAPIEGEIIELPEMVINLKDDEVSYVRVGVALILEEGTLAADFEAESAIAKDVILDDLSSRGAAELRTAEGKQVVKADISEKVREAYDDAKVVRVLFTILVMQ
ncbi:MAG: flagellar basal body-associated protein FliL [Acidimicrobiales bacterium]|jgi:flagellar basal body-associated protein FliL